MTNREFRKIQAELDTMGIATEIRKADKRLYNVIVDWKIIATPKTRETCNKKILEIYKKEKQNLENSVEIFKFA